MPMWYVCILFMRLEENSGVLNPVFSPCEAEDSTERPAELLGLRVLGTIMAVGEDTLEWSEGEVQRPLELIQMS